MESNAVGEFLVRAGLSKLLTLTPRLHPVFEELVGRGFDYGEACTHVVALQRRSLAASRDGLHRISAALEGGDDSTLEQLLEEELANQLQCDSRIGVNEGGRRIIMLIGPPGAGKTSTLAKLAVQVGLVKHRNLHFISMDSHTLGGGRLLRSFAEALGVDHSSCRTNAELNSTLENVRNKDLVLVDSPGYSSSDIGGAADLAALVRGNEEIDTHLVLPAPTSLGDLMSAARRFDIFGPAKLVFTKLDECNSPAAAYGLATQLGKPVSFLSMGPRIPEDLEPATSGRILHLLLHGRTLEIAAAA
jgi:flagellar biosynthesis protein FlhF